MNEASLEAAFKEWWEASYGRPPGTHAVMTHVAFAAHILELMELVQDDSKPTSNDRQIRSSLVERVATVIGQDDENINWKPEARAAIREVAAWLIDRRRDDDWLAPFEELAELLQEEAKQ